MNEITKTLCKLDNTSNINEIIDINTYHSINNYELNSHHNIIKLIYKQEKAETFRAACCC